MRKDDKTDLTSTWNFSEKRKMKERKKEENEKGDRLR
jgi:hypothetical protein